MNKEVFVTDKYMIQALTKAKNVLEMTGYRMSDKEIEDQAALYKEYSSLQ